MRDTACALNFSPYCLLTVFFQTAPELSYLTSTESEEATTTLRQGEWEELGIFLDDVRVPLDNNASERALRRVALGRKNYLFVGNVAAGESLAGLYSLVATCESRGINPYEYLTDVLTRVQDHPAHKLDELLPGPWAAAR